MSNQDRITSIQNNISNNVENIGESIKMSLSSASNIVNDTKNSIYNSIDEFSSKSSINAGSEFLQSNSIVAKFAFLILVLIIFITICNLGITLIGYFTASTKNPYIVYGSLQGNNPVIVSQDPSIMTSIPITRSNNESSGIEFTWSIWLLVSNNTTVNKFQNIFNKGDSFYDNVSGISSVNNGPGLYLSSLRNNESSLRVIMDTVDPSQGPSVIDVAGVPFNKWFHVTMRLENKILDVYVNGTIASRTVMKSVPKQNYNDINICQNGGFNGQLSNLKYFNHALSAFEINTIVMSGPRLVSSKLNTSTSIGSRYPYFFSNYWYSNQKK